MCHLCSTDAKEVAAERKRMLELAEHCNFMASVFQGLGEGLIDPHDSERFPMIAAVPEAFQTVKEEIENGW